MLFASRCVVKWKWFQLSADRQIGTQKTDADVDKGSYVLLFHISHSLAFLLLCPSTSLRCPCPCLSASLPLGRSKSENNSHKCNIIGRVDKKRSSIVRAPPMLLFSVLPTPPPPFSQLLLPSNTTTGWHDRTLLWIDPGQSHLPRWQQLLATVPATLRH